MTAADHDPLDAFSFSLPTHVRFGRGARHRVGEVAASFGRRAVLVSGESFSRSGPAQDVLSSLSAAGVTVVERLVSRGEPDDGQVLAASEALGRVGPDVVVAVGGGSALDLAKAAALLPTADELASWLGGVRVDDRRGNPVLALPTTAGSGAEVSHGAIVLDREARRKRGVRGRGVAARYALVDPELTVTAPPGVAAAAGFDAIAHALETTVSSASSELTRTLAATALPRLLRAVPAAVRDPTDVDAQEQAAFAAMLMGMNLANSTTCLPHRLQYPVGALTRTSHAAGVAALMPAWLERTVAVAPERLGRLAIAAGLADDSETSAAGALSRLVVDLLDRIQLVGRLSDLGVRRDDLESLADAVEGSLANDPTYAGRDSVLDLYRASL